jgi:hypothetical protein
MIESIPYTGYLEIFVEVYDQIAQDIHGLLRSLRSGRHHSLQSSNNERMAIWQANRFMMKARYTLLATLAAIRVDAALGELFGYRAGVCLADYVPGQIHFVQQLLLAGAID